MRSSVASVSLPWRSSERNRAYALSAAGEPASTPRKFGSCPPVASAPRSTGTEPSGAVKSSWIWNLLIDVFIGDHHGVYLGVWGSAAALPLYFRDLLTVDKSTVGLEVAQGFDERARGPLTRSPDRPSQRAIRPLLSLYVRA